MAKIEFSEKKCPFKVEAGLAGGNAQWSVILNDNRTNCVGPKCMAWTDHGGDYMKNCMRMN